MSQDREVTTPLSTSPFKSGLNDAVGIVDQAKDLVALAFATGGHVGLLTLGGPGIAERAPLGKADFIAKKQQRLALPRVA